MYLGGGLGGKRRSTNDSRYVCRYQKTFVKKAPEPDEDELRPFRLVCRINTISDLWRVCLKAPEARAEIPEIEFEVTCSSAIPTIASMYFYVASLYTKYRTHIDNSKIN